MFIRTLPKADFVARALKSSQLIWSWPDEVQGIQETVR